MKMVQLIHFKAMLVLLVAMQGGFARPALSQGVAAADRVEVIAQGQPGFGRLIVRFSDRLSLPSYSLSTAGGVLVLEFSRPVDVALPDVTENLGDYITVARVDPDKMGIRFGLKREFRINRIEAGERLFLDLLPREWSGLDPALPTEVVEELALRAQQAALEAERRRKAKVARESQPELDMRTGRHPTFSRLVFDWSIQTAAKFMAGDGAVSIYFEWPVEVDLYDIKTDLPPEITSVSQTVNEDGLILEFQLADEVKPRFFDEQGQRYTLDLDFAHRDPIGVPLTDLAGGKLPEDLRIAVEEPEIEINEVAEDRLVQRTGPSESRQTEITPFINRIGATARFVFPFEQETPAVVYKRGSAVWMVFDTHVRIDAPVDLGLVDGIVGDIVVDNAGETQIVRINLKTEPLVTLGFEGYSWVLSLGDILISPTEPITLVHDPKPSGHVRVAADLRRPGKIHQIRDPDVGDLLYVATAYPPSRAVVRELEHVDFRALDAVHGLVIKPYHDRVSVAIEQNNVIIDSDDRLILSHARNRPVDEPQEADENRSGFINLSDANVANPILFRAMLEEISNRAADSEGVQMEKARIELAQFYLSAQLAHEAIGVLRVVEDSTKRPQFVDQANLTMGVANVLAVRPDDALQHLLTESLAEALDSLMWQTMARVQRGEFGIARENALLSESVVPGYPTWVQNKFYFAAARAAIEESDASLARGYLGTIEFSGLSREELNLYELLTGRIDEIEGRYKEALDTYGSVMKADIRPVTTEATYRTFVILEKTGKLDIVKARQALEIQFLIWRGGRLAADIQHMLGTYQFRSGDFRAGFETLEFMAVQYQGTYQEVTLYDDAKQVFGNLFLNGEADRLDPVVALSIFYDFRYLAPAGAKGDEMIRNLARRLVKLDLLQQAAELLEYQVDNRLEGVARARVAADLAVIYIADRRPDLALKTLSKTRLANLVPAIARQRRILEARALIDAGRDELAIEILTGLDGKDAALLQVDAHWSGKRYREAAENLESLYAKGIPDGTLSQVARDHMIKAAVAYTLAGDEIGLSRLRAKYSQMMSTTPAWPVFDFVTSRAAYGTSEFRRLARQIAGVDSLNEFLSAYNSQYVDGGALAPEGDATSDAG